MRPGAINKTSQAEVTARLHETPNGRVMMIFQDDNNDDNRKSTHLVLCVHFCSNAPQSFSNVFNKTHNLSLFWVEMHFLGWRCIYPIPRVRPGFSFNLLQWLSWIPAANDLFSPFLTFIFHFLSGFIFSRSFSLRKNDYRTNLNFQQIKILI